MIYIEMISRLTKLSSKKKIKIGCKPESCVDIFFKKMFFELEYHISTTNTNVSLFHFMWTFSTQFHTTSEKTLPMQNLNVKIRYCDINIKAWINSKLVLRKNVSSLIYFAFFVLLFRQNWNYPQHFRGKSWSFFICVRLPYIVYQYLTLC